MSTVPLAARAEAMPGLELLLPIAALAILAVVGVTLAAIVHTFGRVKAGEARPATLVIVLVLTVVEIVTWWLQVQWNFQWSRQWKFLTGVSMLFGPAVLIALVAFLHRVHQPPKTPNAAGRDEAPYAAASQGKEPYVTVSYSKKPIGIAVLGVPAAFAFATMVTLSFQWCVSAHSADLLGALLVVAVVIMLIVGIVAIWMQQPWSATRRAVVSIGYLLVMANVFFLIYAYMAGGNRYGVCPLPWF